MSRTPHSSAQNPIYDDLLVQLFGNRKLTFIEKHDSFKVSIVIPASRLVNKIAIYENLQPALKSCCTAIILEKMGVCLCSSKHLASSCRSDSKREEKFSITFCEISY